METRTRNWTAIGAVSILGLGIAAGGAIAAASAMTLNDTRGADTGVTGISTRDDVLDPLPASATPGPSVISAPAVTTEEPKVVTPQPPTKPGSSSPDSNSPDSND